VLRAERITGCTVHGAPTPKGAIKKLMSSLRSQRKLRLVVWPESGQEPVRKRSSCWPAAVIRGVGRNHKLQNLDDREEAGVRLGFPAPAHIIHEEDVIARVKCN
jgi:hypothetical protein